MDHLEGIVELKNIVSSDLRDKIVPLIKYKSKKHLPTISGIDKKTRNVKGYHLNSETPTNMVYWNYIKQ
jgi:hypothetical protein